MLVDLRVGLRRMLAVTWLRGADRQRLPDLALALLLGI
jgi:hypothetical protein